MEQEGSGVVLLGELSTSGLRETDGSVTCTSSKIGGMPFWIDHRAPNGTCAFAYEESVSLSGVICQNCQSSQNMALVLQAYAPLHVEEEIEGDEITRREDVRVLYVFICLSFTCAHRPEGWKILRGGKRYSKSSHSPNNNSTSSIHYYVEEENRSCIPKWPFADAPWTKKSSISVTDEDTFSMKAIEKLLSLHESQSDKEMSCQSMKPSKNTHKESVVVGITTPTPMFVPIALYIDEEMALVSSITEDDETIRHARHLLREYERHEGTFDEHQFPNLPHTIDTAAEHYSKTPFTHEFKTFHRFQQTLQRYPRQVVRYCLNGAPLLFTSTSPYVPQANTIPPCPQCGHPRRFELQLISTLIPYLKLSKSSPLIDVPSVDFSWGTVFIYTCEQDCWPISNAPSSFSHYNDDCYYYDEYAIFQPDLDCVTCLRYDVN